MSDIEIIAGSQNYFMEDQRKQKLQQHRMVKEKNE